MFLPLIMGFQFSDCCCCSLRNGRVSLALSSRAPPARAVHRQWTRRTGPPFACKCKRAIRLLAREGFCCFVVRANRTSWVRSMLGNESSAASRFMDPAGFDKVGMLYLPLQQLPTDLLLAALLSRRRRFRSREAKIGRHSLVDMGGD